MKMEISNFRAPVLSVAVDGKKKGHVAFAPYIVDPGEVSKGEHTVEITVYGSRINTFGQLHLVDEHDGWYEPDSWRSTGALWSDEYALKPVGVLKSPIIHQHQ